jgi:hypothetical protein
MRRAEDFKYIVLEKNGIADSPLLPLYEQTFEFWKSTWKPIFEKVGSPQAFMIDDFYRQDLIPLILYKGEIIAANFYTIFDLRNPATREMRYFSIFPEHAMNWVNIHGKNRVMTMEFLCVHPDWRNHGGAFSFAEALISLGFELMKSKEIGAAVGVPVKVTGVQEMAKGLSCNVLAENVKRGNLVCDILCQTVNNVKPHHNPNTHSFISLLWNTHENSNDTHSYEKIPLKGAA